ncbi:MAG: two-component regulator propeller domain-containing protein [Bacteroidota bacterium]
MKKSGIYTEVFQKRSPLNIFRYRVKLTILFIFILQSLISQQYNFVNYSINQGLPGSGISVVFQDSKGLLWVGTQSGLASYNGVSWYNFPYKNELSYANISAVFEDKHQNIWIGTKDRGLFMFNGRDTYRFTENNGINSLYIKSICEDEEGSLLISALNIPVLQFDNKNNKNWKKVSFKLYTGKNKIPINAVNSIFKDSDNNIWLGTDKGILLNDGISYERFTLFNGLPHNKIGCIFEDASNRIWFSTPRGVVSYDFNKFTVYNTNNGLISNKVSSIAQDTEGNLWFGTDKGISIFNGQYFYTITEKHGISNNSTTTLFADDSGNLWIGTSFGGLDKYSGRTIENYSTKEGLSSNHVYAVAVDTNNNIFIGTHKGLDLLKFYEHKNYKLSKYTKKSLHCDTINTLYVDTENRKWIGTPNGLAVLSSSKFHLLKKMDTVLVNSIFQEGNNIWIGGNKNLYRISFIDFSTLTIDKIRTFTHGNGLPEGTISATYKDRNNKIWVAYRKNGLVFYNGKHFKHFLDEPNIKNITCLTGNKDALWVGTESNGIYRLMFNKLTQKPVISNFRVENGLSSNRIKSLSFINQNNCIVGTNKGIDKLIFNQNTNLFKVKRVSEAGAYKLLETTERANSFYTKGKVYIGSLQGLVVYDPDKENFDINPPKTHITNVQLYFKDIDWLNSEYTSGATKWFNLPKKLNLPTSKNHLSFDFVGINLKAQDQVMYQWKLSPVEKEWSPPVKKQSVTFSDLSPGSYTFLVRSFNEDGTTDLEPASIKFSIQAPIYKSAGFISSMIILLVISILFFLKFRTRKLKRAKKQLEKEVAERTFQLREEKEKVEHQNKRITQQSHELEDQRDQMLHINEMLESKNRDTTDSINYAKTIQKAMLGPTESIVDIIDKSFAYYKPKDIVSGDFYWFSKHNNVAFIAAVDCTGHGVPGAFMSIIGHSLLNEVLLHDYYRSAAEILTLLDKGVVDALNIHKKNNYAKDGMDIALCKIDFDKKTLNFSGAKRPLYFLEKNNLEIDIIRGERIGIGEKMINYAQKDFKDHFINICKGDRFYIFSDGFIDQFGGVQNKKFLGKRFRSLLLNLKSTPIIDQEKILSDTLKKWKGANIEQADDILVIGVEF